MNLNWYHFSFLLASISAHSNKTFHLENDNPYHKDSDEFWKFESKKQVKILNRFSKADTRLRPNMNNVTKVEAQVQVIGLGPINDMKEEFHITMFFRLNWIDPRLEWSPEELPKQKVLRLNSKFQNDIWLPDIYFLNSISAYLHNNTQQNRLIRVSPNGRVMVSSRISLTLRCNMNFIRFPFDTHLCKLTFGSFQYVKNELWLHWCAANPVELPKHPEEIPVGRRSNGIGLRLISFKLDNNQAGISSNILKKSTGSFSVLSICFKDPPFWG